MFTHLRPFLPWVALGLASAALTLLLMPGLLRPGPVSAPVPETLTTAARLKISFSGAVQTAAPAVVNIHTARFLSRRPSPLLNDPVFKRFFGETLPAPAKRVQTSLGSGVITDPRGYVVTNNHVVAGADEIEVLLRDGRGGRAVLVGSDAESDLAVLRVELPDLPTLRFEPGEQLTVGDVVLAIGNPFGVGQTVPMGIVSATGRSRLGLSTFEDFIQTDAAINPGNSGGALVDAYGRLIGINTAIFSRSGGSQGIGFAIPASLAAQVMREIIANGYVARGWLGIEVRSLPDTLASQLAVPERRGVLVTNLLPHGPAARAGLQPGDVLTHVNDLRVDDPHSAVNAIARTKPGSEAALRFIRQSRRMALSIQVGERPRPEP